MPRTTKFSERIGGVHIPLAEKLTGIDGEMGYTPDPEGLDPVFPERPLPPRGLIDPRVEIERAGRVAIDQELRYRFCRTRLAEGCYTLSFVPINSSIFSTRYRGTMRFESDPTGYTFSGDLYSHRMLDQVIINDPIQLVRQMALEPRRFDFAHAAARTSVIPIYKRGDYYSYLKGTNAMLFGFPSLGGECSFTLTFDEFVYNHPATGFDGNFNANPTRTVRFVMKKTSTSGLYTGDAYAGAVKIGTVSMRWVSSYFRRAKLQTHTLDGAVAPAAVNGENFRTVFANAGWDLTVVDGGTISMPSTIAGQSATDCWSTSNLHRLMESVPGYDPTDLDTVWRSHLLAVQAELGCSRGVMFDSSGDLNDIGREGSSTFSDDGYNASDSANFGAVEDELQRNVPRAFLRSASHEVGHAFNQIHQSFEGGNDNSIMTTTPSVADVLAAGGQTFPDDILMAFNDTVKQHLKHYPDPAVRPGAMSFFGSAVGAPEPADVAWIETLEVEVRPSTSNVRLGEPLSLTWKLTNTGKRPVPVPEDLTTRALISRVSVTDSDGKVTFMRPLDLETCSRIRLVALEPGASLTGETVLCYGRDGFAMEKPGRHTVEVIVLWELAGVPVAAAGEADVWVAYPRSDQENQVAALLLDPDVGRAVALRDISRNKRAASRIRDAVRASRTHPAHAAIRKFGASK